MEKRFDIKMTGVKLDLKDNKFHFESVKNKYGTWNLFLHVFYVCPENPQKNVIHASLVLVSSQNIHRDSFPMVKIHAKSRNSGSKKDFLPMLIYNEKYFYGKRTISFNFDASVSPIDIVFTINAANLPCNSGLSSSQSVELPKIHRQEQDFGFEKGKFADVIFKTKGGKEIIAHKWILSRSKIFHSMLNVESKDSRQKVIEVKDVDYDLMREFIRFLYCNSVPKMNEARNLLVLAYRYEIPELVHICGSYLIVKNDIESIADILLSADKFNMRELKQSAINLAVKNWAQLKKTEGWKKLKEAQPRLALEVAEMF